MPTPGGFTLKNRYGTFTKNCPTLRGIINKISAKERIMADEVEEILDHYHKWASDCMSSETAPNMFIPNFGKFIISSTKLRNRIRIAIENYRRGNYSYERTCEIIRRFWPLYKRANIEEIYRGRGVNRSKGGVVGNMTKAKSKAIQKKIRKDWSSFI